MYMTTLPVADARAQLSRHHFSSEEAIAEHLISD